MGPVHPAQYRRVSDRWGIRMRKLFLLLFALTSTAALAQMGPPPMQPPTDPVLASGDFDGAEKAYAATLAKTPGDAAALVGLARIRLYQERRAESRKLAEQALAVDANNPLAQRILAAVGQREAAFVPQVYQIDLPKGGARIPFVATDPLPIVKVRVAGKDAYFVIDTGGPDLTLDADFAHELGLQLMAGPPGTFAGGMQAMVQHASLPEFAIGDAHVRNIPVAVMPTRDFGLSPTLRIDGVVGGSFLMHFLSTLDYKGGALVLKPRSDSGAFQREAVARHATVAPMWLVGDHFVFVRAHLNAAPDALFNVDTGLAGGGVQATRAMLDAAHIVPDESKATSERGGGGMVRSVAFTADATMGGLTVKDVRGVFTPDGDQFGFFPFKVGGTLSHGFFRAHALTLDFVAMKVIVD